MKGFNIFFGAFVLLTTSLNGQSPLQNYIDEWAGHPDLSSSNVSVSVFDINDVKLVAGHRSNNTAIPASSLKVITSLIALEQLGENYKYNTYLAHDGSMDDDGTLKGNLYIIGSGDPSLGSGRFENYPDMNALLVRMVDGVKAYGITCIDGDIIVDESIFSSFPIAPTWQWNDLGNYYAGGAWGFNINENEYAIYYNTKGQVGSWAKFVYTDPKIQGLELQHEVKIDSAGTGDNSYIFGGPYVYTKRVVGKLGASDQLFKIKGSMPDPPAFAAGALQNALYNQEILSSGSKVIHQKAGEKRVYFDSISSPPLLQMSEETNHKSLNLYCEAFLKTLGLTQRGIGSSEEGIVYVEDYLLAHGFDLKGFNMKDGSGLSARTYVTSALMAGFIADYAKRNSVAIIMQQLPQAGKEGTVKGILSGNKIGDNFWMKSGTMDRVVSFTGICKNKNGEWKSFSIIVNNYEIPYRFMRGRIEKLFDAIYNYS